MVQLMKNRDSQYQILVFKETDRGGSLYKQIKNEVTYKLMFEDNKYCHKMIQDSNQQNIWKYIEPLLSNRSKCCIKKEKFDPK